MKQIITIISLITIIIFGAILEKSDETVPSLKPEGDSYMKVKGYNFYAKEGDDQWVYYDAAQWDTTPNRKPIDYKINPLGKALEDAMEDYLQNI